MSIKLRLTLLVSLLLLGFLTTYLLLRALEREEFAQLTGEEQRVRAQLLTHWIELSTRTLPQFVGEAAESEELRQLLAETSAAAKEKIAASLARAGLHGLWVINSHGMPRAEFGPSPAAGAQSPAAFPLTPDDFRRLVRETPNPRFFALIDGKLIELAVRRSSAADTTDWLVVGRYWDDVQVRSLAELTESEVSILGPDALNYPPSDARLVLLRPLMDWQGRPLRTLRIEHDLSKLVRSVESGGHQTRLFFAYGLLVLAAVTLALQGWVLRPLKKIDDSLSRNDSQPVQELTREKSELGQLARLVQSSFAQRESLEREVKERAAAQQALERSEAELRRTFEERARLGRDLHDGVIQSLYAAGMGLAGIRNQLHPDQSEAAARLEQTRAALNETIHDVRNFIIGLEPEALKQHTFSQAVAALLETMQSLRPFRSSVDIDESLAGRLTLAQRVHALQITREAVSNALRHGAANNLGVTLRLSDGFAEFEIRDDGTGFVPHDAPTSGHGLRNLAQRARELGAELTVDSQPGAGARVKLIFSLHPYD